MTCERRHRARDEGVTLPELLIGVLLLGLIMASLSAVVIAVVKQQDNTTGRLNNARSEQQVGIWMPADLASAEAVDTTPNGTPCGSQCPAGTVVDGSNALMLSWTNKSATNVVTTTKVSYRYRLGPPGDYQLVRVRCVQVGAAAPSCTTSTVLHHLDPPPSTFTPGVTSPSWVMQVSKPLDPADIGDPDNPIEADPDAITKNAQRIEVTINGGGDSDGAGGGQNQISLSAGGTERTVIDATSLSGTPSFTQARSRCGGPLTLIVDTSGSIGAASMTQVISGVRGFIDNVTGTPLQVQVIAFSDRSRVLAPSGNTSWHHYWDMLDPAAVSGVKSAIGTLVSSGSTNWEDALFRTFYNKDGTTPAVLPKTTVFFTDGVPNSNRRFMPASTYTAANATPSTPTDKYVYPTPSQGDFQMEGFYRADYLASFNRSTSRFIGVLVGAAASGQSEWVRSTTNNVLHYAFYKYQTRATPADAWADVNKSTYDAQTTSSNKRLVSITVSTYVSSAADRRLMVQVSKAAYDSLGPDYRYAFYGDTAWLPNSSVLAKLVAGGGNDSTATTGVRAVADQAGNYTNAATANMYVLPKWSQFAGALEAVALDQCGGTLTLQTKVDGAPATDPFTYQNTGLLNSKGNAMPADLEVVTTTRQFVSGTFDFETRDFVTVEIQPQNLSDLTAYAPVGWVCTASGQPRAMTTFSIPNSAWTGIRVKVAANEAVSCVQNVQRVS